MYPGSEVKLPIKAKIPPITWFALKGGIDGGRVSPTLCYT